MFFGYLIHIQVFRPYLTPKILGYESASLLLYVQEVLFISNKPHKKMDPRCEDLWGAEIQAGRQEDDPYPQVDPAVHYFRVIRPSREKIRIRPPGKKPVTDTTLEKSRIRRVLTLTFNTFELVPFSFNKKSNWADI